MDALLTYLDTLTNAPTVESLWEQHTCRMNDFGFDRIIYGFTRYRSGGSLGDPQDWVLLTNHGDSYMEGFLDHGHIYRAPMIRWALNNTGPCSWRWMADPENLTSDEQTAIAFNMRQRNASKASDITLFTTDPNETPT